MTELCSYISGCHCIGLQFSRLCQEGMGSGRGRAGGGLEEGPDVALDAVEGQGNNVCASARVCHVTDTTHINHTFITHTSVSHTSHIRHKYITLTFMHVSAGVWPSHRMWRRQRTPLRACCCPLPDRELSKSAGDICRLAQAPSTPSHSPPWHWP